MRLADVVRARAERVNGLDKADSQQRDDGRPYLDIPAVALVFDLPSKRSFRNDAAIERNDNYDDNYAAGLNRVPEPQQEPGK